MIIAAVAASVGIIILLFGFVAVSGFSFSFLFVVVVVVVFFFFLCLVYLRAALIFPPAGDIPLGIYECPRPCIRTHVLTLRLSVRESIALPLASGFYLLLRCERLQLRVQTASAKQS